MDLDPNDLPRREAYALMTSLVVPRPIGWISTVDADDRPNLAPFSFFGGVSSHPPIVSLSVGRRRGVPKDTAANLLATGEGVVHICHRPLAESMVLTSAEVPPGEDEFALAGLTKIPARRVRAPRVAEAAVALEVEVLRHLEVGEGATDLFLLHVLHIHVADAFVSDGRVDPARLRAVGRLGGIAYCDTASPFEIPRPS
jgi:flavin reductase (DIM6/NTAB) family NADH-FMN oxidoreductase RutF